MSASSRPELESLIQEALDLSEAGQSEGLERLSSLCEKHADYAPAWRARALAESELEQPEKALASIEKALELAPEDTEGWQLKAEVLLDLERPEEALTALERGLDVDDEDADLWFEKAATLLGLVRAEEALAAFDKVMELEPEHQRAASNRADLLARMGRFEDACAAFERALELSPGETRLWVKLGQVRLDAGQYPASLEAFDRALKLNEGDWEAWSNRGLALANLDRMEEALRCYDRAVELEPNNPIIFYNKAVALEVMRDFAGAADAIRRWIEIDPERPEAHLSLGRVLERLGFKEQAQQCLDRAFQLNPFILGPMQIWGLALADESGQPAPGVPPVQVRTNMPPEQVVKEYVQMLVDQGHKVENGLVDGKWRVNVFPVQQFWGLGLFDENGQPNTDVPPVQVQTEMPPQQFVPEFVKKLQEAGHKVDENGLVDGKWRVGVFPLQGAPVAPVDTAAAGGAPSILLP